MPNSFDRRSRCFSSAVTRLIRQERGAERRGEAGSFSVRSCATSALCGRLLSAPTVWAATVFFPAVCGATRGSISVCASRATNQRPHRRKGLSYFCCRRAQSRPWSLLRPLWAFRLPMFGPRLRPRHLRCRPRVALDYACRIVCTLRIPLIPGFRGFQGSDDVI